MSSLATRLKGRSELGVALLLGAAGVIVFLDASRLAITYSRTDPVGPKTLPYLVAGLLVVCAVFLAIDVLRGGKGEAEGGEDVDLEHPADWKTVIPWRVLSSLISCLSIGLAGSFPEPSFSGAAPGPWAAGITSVMASSPLHCRC
ncbi:tripartite tricarboxylate transporter TctB family protein [Arthrobacter ulcerisalmonis]|uniref:tripartite tricarboxylate transporter TctB family protein n=1 Tax=Arthrobacter ulcerisalmonis TaxID=2483813 RepID=UPI003628F7BA